MLYTPLYCLVKTAKDKYLILAGVLLLAFSLSAQNQLGKVLTDEDIAIAAWKIPAYLPLLEGKSVAVVANQTSLVNHTHLVDTLLSLGVKIKKVFAPEHGFRGMADAGEHVKNERDSKTGLPVISLYGENKKPKAGDLKNIDVVIFDVQDVGVRYYTYISSMHYVMEACAENNKLFLVLDRPNPNGFLMDGPVLEEKYKSFVGMHPVPLVHGMTVAEYALMINGEGWLKNAVQCSMEYVLCEGYSHKDYYQLPVKPSPNLPNMDAVYLYPSLGLFEGTVVSVGRGTEKPFQIIGHPQLTTASSFRFTPASVIGAKYPPHDGEICHGYDLTGMGEKVKEEQKIYLKWLIETYTNSTNQGNFFHQNKFFDRLAGTATLRKQITEGKSEEHIRESWQEGLEKFRKLRKKYLLYEDFE